MSLFWPLGRPWKRERRRGINGRSWWKCVERKKLEFWKRLEFWKMEKLVVVKEGRELKEKEKRKRNYNEKIFSWERR